MTPTPPVVRVGDDPPTAEFVEVDWRAINAAAAKSSPTRIIDEEGNDVTPPGRSGDDPPAIRPAGTCDEVGYELPTLAYLALHGTRRDVEAYVHRLAYRHRGSDRGAALAAVDVVPGVSLRGDAP